MTSCSRWVNVGCCVAFMAIVFAAYPPTAHAQTVEDFFNPDTLQELHVEIASADWDALKAHYLENTYYSVKMSWLFGGQFIEVANVGIRSRGTGSRSPVKPGLGVDFSRYVSGQTFLGLKGFTLRNNTQDASMMHEAVSMALMRRMGMPASREAYARLYVNGEYQGLYTFVESVDESFLAHNFGEQDGYLYSYDYAPEDAPYFFEYRGADPALYSPKPFKAENHSKNPDPGPLAEMIAAINLSSDADFENAMRPYLDLKLFLKEIALEGYLAEQDGILGDWGVNNLFLYRFVGTKRSQFLPWDKSNAFNTLDRSIWLHTEGNVLVRRALAVPALQAFYMQTLTEIAAAAGGPGGWLESEIDRVYTQIAEAAHEDPYKQCYDETGLMRTCSNEEFDAEAAFMTRFARERGDAIGRELVQASTSSFAVPQDGTLRLKAQEQAQGQEPVMSSLTVTAEKNGMPASFVLQRVNRNGVVVSEIALPPAPVIYEGRLHVVAASQVRTVIAIANPGPELSVVSFYFTDAQGRDQNPGSLAIPPNGQIARFLDEAPFSGPTSFSGSMTIQSSTPIGVNSFRALTNERGDFLLAAVPIADLAQSVPNAGIVPYVVDGGGYQTEIVVVNPFDRISSGSIVFRGTDGRINWAADYLVPPRTSRSFQTPGTADAALFGFGQILSNEVPPLFYGIVSSRQNGVTISQTGIAPAQPAAGLRLFAETSGAMANSGPGSRDTEAVLVNPSSVPVDVTIQASTLEGDASGRVLRVTVAPGCQVVVLFGSIGGYLLPTERILTVSTPSASGIVLLGVRFMYNARRDLLLTALEPVTESSTEIDREVFPLFVNSGDYSAEIVLFGRYPGQTAAGRIVGYSPSGAPSGLQLSNTDELGSTTVHDFGGGVSRAQNRSGSGQQFANAGSTSLRSTNK